MEDQSLEHSMKFCSQIQPLLEEVLGESRTQPDPPLNPAVCQILLDHPSPLSVDVNGSQRIDESVTPGLRILTGYPSYPLYKRLATSISYWIVSGHCPVFDLPVMFMLNEQSAMHSRTDRLEALTSKLSGAYPLWDCWSQDEKKYFIIDVLRSLELRGVMYLLGIRHTVGSSDILPPPKEVLLQSFLKLHCPPAKLTVGARALTKHHHRDDTAGWWGKCTGSEDDKNKHALSLVLKIMDNATWINIHSLPHEVKVVEMRTIEGYGVRWLLDGSEFRGFLEPQMEDGHEVGWRH